MNKKRMTGKRFCRRIAVVMMAVLVAMTALPAFSEVTASAAEKAKNTVQIRIGGKKMTKKTYRMRQGTKKKLKLTGKKIKSVRFRSSKKVWHLSIKQELEFPHFLKSNHPKASIPKY